MKMNRIKLEQKLTEIIEQWKSVPKNERSAFKVGKTQDTNKEGFNESQNSNRATKNKIKK